MSVVPPLNPVLAREVKERLRSGRATVIITIYLGLLSLLLYILYSSARSASQFGDPMASESALLGRVMFETILLVMLGLVLFIVPALTADAVTGERERQTLVPLQVTLLRPRSILLGKLLASLAFTALLSVATLPLFGISFIVGGVSVGQVVKGVLAVLVVALVAGSLTLWCSAMVRRTQVANVLAYFLVGVLVVGSFAFYGAQWALAARSQGERPGIAVLHLNPFLATADFVAVPGDGIDAPLQSIADFIREQERRRGDQLWNDGGFVDDGAFAEEELVFDEDGLPVDRPEVVAPAPRRAERNPVPFWARSTLLLVALGAGAFALAARRIETPSDRAAAG